MRFCSNKNCTQNNPQSLESFGKKSANKDGLDHKCLVCRRLYKKELYDANPDYQKRWNTAYIKKHPKKRAETQLNYYNKARRKKN